jgi:hypothetical protein
VLFKRVSHSEFKFAIFVKFYFIGFFILRQLFYLAFFVSICENEDIYISKTVHSRWQKILILIMF